MYKANVYAKSRFFIHNLRDVYARMGKRIHIVLNKEAKEGCLT